MRVYKGRLDSHSFEKNQSFIHFSIAYNLPVIISEPSAVLIFVDIYPPSAQLPARQPFCALGSTLEPFHIPP